MNKKKAIIIAIAAVLLIGLTLAGLIIGTRGKKETGVKAETTEAMASADKEEKADHEQPEVKEDTKDTAKKEEKKDAKKDNQKAEKDTVKDEIKDGIDTTPTEQPKTTEQPKQATEQKPQAEAPKTTEQQAAETPKQPEQPKVTAEQPTTEKQKVWHEPVYEDVWVVDVPEHTEKQVVDVKYVDKCYCGHIFTDQEDFNEHAYSSSQCRGFWGDVPVYTYEDVTIPEQGHYEQKLVTEGYWE